MERVLLEQFVGEQDEKEVLAEPLSEQIRNVNENGEKDEHDLLKPYTVTSLTIE